MVDLAFLQDVPALAEVPPEALRALADRAREVEFEEDERIVPLLEPPARLLFIHDGLAKMVGVSANGIERIIYVFKPGDITGSRVLLEESAEAAYEIVAMTSIHAAAVSKRDFLRVGEDHPEVLMAVTQAFTRRLDHMTARMLAAMSAEVPVRLSQLLLDFAETGDGADPSEVDSLVPLTYPLTHESMAQIIGASRPHTSTVLRDLEEHEAVRRRSQRGLLVRPSTLRDIARSGALERDTPD